MPFDPEHDQARRIGEGDWGPLKPTGLAKICPRCGRMGWVFAHQRDSGGFVIVWEGPPRGGGSRPANMDEVGESAGLLFDPTMGCGYDGASDR